ncbi:divergent PAP2 family protein [Brevibacillus ruminantium]|uniref:Divergent PAP2 family protein n=1 Tax=Brevibacillus ruminantium TaxID=2950604 RepID=A0ABY4WJ87_9BACL|nr:divergent PAP2 family protein [Brevibacillus ruminantium]USG66856.1 divergent PAP2 family protein [Brevibacillus ruminantium]
MAAIFDNFPLWAALIAIGIAQFVKIPLTYFATRSWQWSLMFSTGGMPSSHSSAVTALSTAVGIREGFTSSMFAISAIIGVIVMFDAAGVRRHAGMQAVVLNKLVDEFNHLLEGMKTFRVRPNEAKAKKLKELLGHQPIEVLIGGWLGIMIALAVYRLFYI